MSENSFTFLIICIGTFFGIISVLVGFSIDKSKHEGSTYHNDAIDIAFFSFIAALLSAAIFAILNCIIIYVAKNEQGYTEVETHYTYPVSANINSEVYGEFVLGSGKIETTSYYYFYKDTENGYQLDKVEVANSYIIETDEREPEIVLFERKYNGGFIKLNNDFIRRTIYVPEGTIINQFNL
jgi:hypothetical protein